MSTGCFDVQSKLLGYQDRLESLSNLRQNLDLPGSQYRHAVQGSIVGAVSAFYER